MSTAFATTDVKQLTLNRFMPDGATSADVQSAIDAALATGGGLVDLGTASYAITSTVTLDPTRVSLVGDGATFDGTPGASNLVLLKIETPSGATLYTTPANVVAYD